MTHWVPPATADAFRLMRRRFGPRRGTRKLLAAADRARDARNWASAVHYYRRALEGSPNNAAAWVQYGHALKEAGRVGDAEDAYRKSLDLDARVADTHLQLGHALKLQGRHADAAIAYLRAIALEPQLPHAALELAHLGWITEACVRSGNSGVHSNAPSIVRPLLSDDKKYKENQPALVFDISNIIQYFSTARLPQGIQRVQLNLITAILRRQDLGFPVMLACFRPGPVFWVRVPNTLFQELAKLTACGGDTDDPAWRALLGKVELVGWTGDALRFPQRSVLVCLGPSWYLANYFLGLQLAKSQFRIRYIQFVHDIIPIATPEHCGTGHVQEFIGWLISVLRLADDYLVNSEATAADLGKVAGVLGFGAVQSTVVRLDGSFGDAGVGVDLSDRLLKQHELDREPFVLFVGTIESRKNHLLAFQSWLSLIERRGLRSVPLLVCVGRQGWLVDAAMALLHSSEMLRRKVLILSDVSDAELAELYRRCIVTLYPSLYEGWGLPVTESLCYGKVPLISAVSSLPEAGGEFAEYFECGRERDLTEKLERLLDDTAYRRAREENIRRNFRPRAWDEIAGAIVDRARCLMHLPLPDADDEVEVGELWALPAQTGRYYPIRRNLETEIRRGLVAAEIYRVGQGWWPAEDWGTWLRAEVAYIGFSLAENLDSRHLVFLYLQGTPRSPVEFRVGIRGARATESGTLGPDERRWVIMAVEPSEAWGGIIHVRLETDGRCDFAEISQGRDRRVVTLAVIGFYVCREDDLLSRVRFIEALQLGRLDQL
jgi:glycosyltransferase involved in cell wall biosynthesis